MTGSIWCDSSCLLAEAYDQKVRPERFAVVTRALLYHLATRKGKVLDIGGGYGRQAIDLAKIGFDVTVLDIDDNMIERAIRKLAHEDDDVRRRINFVHCDATNAVGQYHEAFDLVCCHSVLIYEHKIDKIIEAICRSVKKNGLVSILSLNTKALAMRPALRGEWSETVKYLTKLDYSGDNYVQSVKHDINDIIRLLKEFNVVPVEWYGVGIFTDHLESCDNALQDLTIEAEWLAGRQDPYRSVARNIHLVCHKVSS